MKAKPLTDWTRRRFVHRYLWEREWGKRGRCVWTAIAERRPDRTYGVSVGRSRDGSGILDLAGVGFRVGYPDFATAKRECELLVTDVIAMDTKP